MLASRKNKPAGIVQIMIDLKNMILELLINNAAPTKDHISHDAEIRIT